ncbi:MAG TPA: S8 family serine peptidase [Micromonosporaceae bacterium]
MDVVLGDCNGHGTHVAGTIGSRTYGVAKLARLHGVKVLNCAGIGTNSAVIAGIDWVAGNHASPAVANMSLSGGQSDAVNTATNNLANTPGCSSPWRPATTTRTPATARRPAPPTPPP